MQQKYCIKQECLRKAQGAFLLAHKMGLLEDPSMEGLEARRQNHNEKLKMMEQEEKLFYGPRYFSAPAYLQYELTRLKLNFVQPSEAVRSTGHVSGCHRAGEERILRKKIWIYSVDISEISLLMKR